MPIVLSNLLGEDAKIDIDTIYPRPIELQVWSHINVNESFDDIVRRRYNELPEHTYFMVMINRQGGFMIAIGLKTNHNYGFYVLIGYQNDNIMKSRLYNGSWTSRLI